MKNKLAVFTASFLFVLFSIALGHIAMSVVEKYCFEYQNIASLIFFVIGFIFLFSTKFGIYDGIWQNIGGVFGGLFIWTGLEYSFIFCAQRFNIQPSSNGSDPEYLIMEWSWGVFILIFAYLLFQESVRCSLIFWLRKKMRLMKNKVATGKIYNYGPRVAMEYATITWSGYLACMIVFDEQIFGAFHPATYILFVVTGLSWLYTAWRAFKQVKFGSMMRWIIPTVIIFWTAFLEIIPKWGGFIQPWETGNWYVMGSIVAAFLFTAYLFISHRANVR
ncbi:MAG: hypothetical protein ACE5D6_03170 [Candidatus Zixiibacteriota bacterium]